MQDTLIEELKQKLTDLTETNKQLEVRNQRLADDSSYAKGLASAAAVELKALSEEVAKLMTQNEKLTAELTALKSSHSRSNSNSHQPPSRRATGGTTLRNGRRSDSQAMRRQDQQGPVPSANDMKKELALSREREMAYEAALLEKDQNETELHDRLEESKQREAYLENELANMWVLVAKLKKSTSATESGSPDITKENHLLEGFGV
ncbi:hypothetical protein SAY86_024221 [Trapa natans]|uniref:Uncharacterized protein n=1 Tax=Trapa natans TaxID=22666 RepID=A0AAN7RHS6_TRANT|nr:hypothetical protein SAY86_024221 [Trapa natans]